MTALLENCVIDSTVFGSMVGYGFIDFVETTKGSKGMEGFKKSFFHIFRPLYGKISVSRVQIFTKMFETFLEKGDTCFFDTG
jgi:hypothetical protein